MANFNISRNFMNLDWILDFTCLNYAILSSVRCGNRINWWLSILLMPINVETCISRFTIQSHSKSVWIDTFCVLPHHAQQFWVHPLIFPQNPIQLRILLWDLVWPSYLRDLDSLITGHNKLKVFCGHWCPTLDPQADERLAACEILRVFVIPLIGGIPTPLANLWSEAVIPLALEDICCLTQKPGMHETTSVKGLPRNSHLLMP